MAEKRKKYPRVVTPAGVAAYSYIHKPDTKGQYADNKYKTTIIFPGDADMSKITAACVAAAKMEWGDKVKMSTVKLPIRDGDTKGKEEFEGKLLITAKSKYAPGVVDSRREALADGVEVWSGDLIKVSCETYPCVIAGQKTITLQLRNVQLIEKRSRAGTAADDFEDESEDEEDEDQEAETHKDGDIEDF